MLKAKKEELQERGVKGFTLMEMLIVVAIIAVLIAIAIPTFTAQLENSREATDAANLRSAYAEVKADYLMNNASSSKTVASVQADTTSWSNSSLQWPTELKDSTTGKAPLPGANGWTVSINASGVVTIAANPAA